MTLFVANRGEIAVRILRSAKELGLPTAVAYTLPDRDARHVREADRAVPIAGYLDGAAWIAAAQAVDASLVHPGYGFLSENAEFARMVEDAGLIWVGPPPDAIAAMGDKVRARRLMQAAGVPVVPGVESTDPATIATLGFPLLLKAAKGGGGRGMREVHGEGELVDALREAHSEAARAFGDGAIYAERRILRPRHVEVQVLADSRGRTIHLHERECSIQRRHQKVVEEAPCGTLSPAVREALCAAAVRAAEAVRYEGAGTVEFLLAPDGTFSFLEMNTRIQVEHAVTECITGIDLVRHQLLIALGDPLPFDGVEARGHALEVRIYAEDPALGFVGSAGRLRRYRPPSGPGVRVDDGVTEGWTIPVDYDPMIAKLVTHAETREAARTRMLRALAEYEIAGVPTTAELLRDVLAHPAFVAGDLATDFLDRHFADWTPPDSADVAHLAAFALGRTAAPVASGPVDAPTPWQTLGRWP